LAEALGGQDVMFIPGMVKFINRLMFVWTILHIPMFILSRGRYAQRVYLFYLYAAFGVICIIYQTCDVDITLRVSTQAAQNCSLLLLSLLLLSARRFLEYSVILCGTSIGWIAFNHTAFMLPRGPAIMYAFCSIIGGMWALSNLIAILLEIFNRRTAEAHAKLTDYNARLKAEVEKHAAIIKQQQEKAFETQKMEAIGLMAGGVAHDFNNKLTVISGYCDILSGKTEPDSPSAGHLRSIMKATEDAARLTRQLLSFSRREMINPQVVSLNAVVVERREMLSRIAGERVEFVTSLAPGLGNCRFDAGQMEQVFVNLVTNALDAMKGGGRLEIKTFNAVIGEEAAALPPGTRPGQYVTLVVSDTGHGMNAVTKSHLFEPFFTTKPKGEGTGLGLATIYGMVRQNGGFIEVESEPGRGSVFSIHLPRTDAPVAPEAAELRHETVRQSGATILVAEDEPGVLNLISEVLVGAGYRVLAAGSPAEAVRVSAEHPGPLDLLLCDVIMPGGGVKTTISGITAGRPGIRTLYMSGYADEVVVNQGVLDARKNFLRKPFRPAELIRKVEEVLGAPA